MKKALKVLKWVGISIGGILLLLLATVYTTSEIRMNRTYKIKKERITIPTDDLAIERGKHLFGAVAKCVDCHGEDLGGHTILDEPLIGTFAGPNLTRGKGGLGGVLKDEDYVRAIRHTVGRDGKPLAAMPSENWHISDEDLGAIIAYIKSAPPVDRPSVESSFGPVIRLMLMLGEVQLGAEEIDHTAKHPPTPPAGPTAEYGQHLVMIGGCVGCHGPGLTGGAIPGAPPDFPHAQNLTPEPTTGLGKWSEDDFLRALRTGKRPDGTELRDPMPWKVIAKMSPDELHAIWLYLRTLKPAAAGNR
jgi:mono/diheme cytochrome c family protein